MNFSLNRTVIALIFILARIAFSSNAQNNPVIQFEKALIIQTSKPVTYARYGRTEFPYDPVGFGLISGTLQKPESGKKLEGTEAQWENISATEDGYFKSEKLNGGGIYFEYNSPKNQIMILDASGHDKVFINGVPREGDHFDTGKVKIPVDLKKGINGFYLTGGIMNRIKASLYLPAAPIMLTTDFTTKPDLLQYGLTTRDGRIEWVSVVLMNNTNLPLKELVIQSVVNDTLIAEIPAGIVEKLTTRRLPVKMMMVDSLMNDSTRVVVNLLSKAKKLISSVSFYLKNKGNDEVHERTFISNIDGSVQYFSVIPGKIFAPHTDAGLIMAVHGAGLEAKNLAKVYKPKDWANIVLPTNRGAFGFAWEDWGRLDFLEVYEIGKLLFWPDPQRIYLTGHSMGGHASWYLGATYPDKWAAIGPCAGYPQLHEWIGHTIKDSTGQRGMFIRAGSSQQTKMLYRNYLGKGIYINHGDADPTVSVKHAREMRSVLGKFHSDFAYYEYPGGNHWYGDLSADWPPLFDFLKMHTIPVASQVRQFEFNTFSPGVSASSHWATIYQQEHPYQLSHLDLEITADSTGIISTTKNVKILGLDLGAPFLRYPVTLDIDKQKILIEQNSEKVWLSKNENDKWTQISSAPDLSQKGPHRNGNFKDAFRHNMVFVYGTKGTPDENIWLYNKAKYDAETFGYRGNGSIEIIPDNDFDLKTYADRSVIIYGNSVNNSAWKLLLSESPIQVMADKIVMDKKEIAGQDLACYFIVPRKDSKIASVGVIAGTGLKGLKATYANIYFQAGTAFPDFTVFRSGAAIDGYKAVECAGYFGNDWGVGEKEVVWKE